MSVPLLGAGLAVDVLPFTPASISGLQLWLDASDASTLFQNSNGTTAATADGDPVGYWGDKSGNGRHATQSDGTKKPALKVANQNGKNTTLFDGSNDFLQTASSGLTTIPYTYLIAFRPMATDLVTRRCFCGVNAVGNLDIFQGLGPRKWSLYANYPYGVNGGQAIAGTKYLVYALVNSSSSVLDYNGSVLTGNAGSGVPNGFYVAGLPAYSEYGNNYYYEILVYNKLLSNTEITNCKNYLNAKWSIY